MNLKKASSNRLKHWRKLLMSKFRKQEKLFLAEGERCIEQILENDAIKVNEIVLLDGWNPSELVLASGAELYTVDEDELAGISDTKNPQGILAICSTPEEVAIHSLSERSGILLAIDAIQDPGNLGAIIRSAAWFGVDGLILGKGTVDPYHPKVVRGTAGSTGTISICSGDLNDILKWLEDRGRTIYLLDAGEESKPLHSVNNHSEPVLVIGNEANGIQPKLFTKERHRIRIQGQNRSVESLNAAIACSISLFHFSNH